MGAISIKNSFLHTFTRLILSTLLLTCFFGNTSAFGQQIVPPVAEVTDLKSAISVALRHNKDVRTAYLQRETETFALRVAEDLFSPRLEFSATTTAALSPDSGSSSLNTTSQTSLTANLLVPTGGQLSFTWSKNFDSIEGFEDAQDFEDVGGNDVFDNNGRYAFSFAQPLLRGGGLKFNRAPVQAARLNERINILNLKATLIDTVTSVITSYRQYLSAQRRVDIAQRAVERGQNVLDTNKALLESGRVASIEVAQSETDNVSRALDLSSAKNDLDLARLDFLDILDVDLLTDLSLDDELQPTPFTGDVESIYQTALIKQPAILQSALQLELATRDQSTSRNDRLWNLDFNMEVASTGNAAVIIDTSDPLTSDNIDELEYSVGLSLTIPFGDLEREQQILEGQNNLQQASLTAEEQLSDLRTTIEQQVSQITSLQQQVDIAKRLVELAEKQLDIEKFKLSEGLSSSFQISDFESQFIDAQNAELDATVSYMEALSQLDALVGTTLETWDLTIDPNRAFLPAQER